MTPNQFLSGIVDPTLKWMAASPGINIPATDAARVLVMAIAGQESLWRERRQLGGPARGFWQFERGGGLSGVVHHPATMLKFRVVCGAQDIPTDLDTMFEALAWHDQMACAFARLLLWTDAAPLPQYWDKAAGWQYYERLWKPGAPHPETWSDIHDQAMAACGLPPT